MWHATAAYVLIGYLMASGLSGILLVGKDRKPVQPSAAALAVVFDGAAAFGVAYLAGWFGH